MTVVAQKQTPMSDEYVCALGQIASSLDALLHALEKHSAVRKRGLPIEASALPLSRSLRVLVERTLDAARASLREPLERPSPTTRAASGSGEASGNGEASGSRVEKSAQGVLGALGAHRPDRP